MQMTPLPRGTDGELWQPRFFDRALRTVKEYNEKVEYIHLNPVRGGGQPPGRLVPPCGIKLQRIRRHERRRIRQPTDGLIVDRVRMPFDPPNLIAPSRGRKDADHKSGGPESAGINRQEAENERFSRGRSSDPLGPEFCAGRREAHSEA